MNKVLVTGATGYIGSSFTNIFYDKYKFIQFSLQKESIENIDFNDVDVVLHCAALVHQKIEYSYEKYYKINVEYPVKLAKKAKVFGVKQFVFISTIAVYGEDKQLVRENTECNPVTPYGRSKLEAEKKLLELSDENFTVSIIRTPLVYGKNALGNIDSLVKFIKKVPIIPFGSIHNKKSFIYIGNLSHFVEAVIDQNKSGVFLASDDEPLSTTKLIELIAKNLDKKVYLIKIPFFETLLKLVKPSFHKRLYQSLEVDNTNTKKVLGFKNIYTTDEGINFMIYGENR